MLKRDKKRYRDDALEVDAGVISTPRKKGSSSVARVAATRGLESNGSNEYENREAQ